MALGTHARGRTMVAIASLLVFTLLLGGCTDDPNPPANTSGSMASPEFTSATSSATSTLTAEEQAASDAALAAYNGMWSVDVASMEDPGADWYAAYRQYVGDPALSLRISDRQAYAAAGVIGQGAPERNPKITSISLAQPPTVLIADCIDVTGWDLIKEATGESVRDEENQPPRYMYEATVQRYDDGIWLVNETKALLEKPC